MAEYCSACSRDIFKRDGQDFSGLTSVKDFKKGLACVVVCEGCGIIQVDPRGCCISDCSRRNYPGHNGSWEVKKNKTILDKMLSLFFRLLS